MNIIINRLVKLKHVDRIRYEVQDFDFCLPLTLKYQNAP